MKELNKNLKEFESKFERDEIFFSTTDLEGNTLSGNSMFSKVSKYSFEELIGKPYSTLIHPDTPKVVLRLVWDYIKSGKSVVAYIKNMAKDGSYYWVLLVASPLFYENGSVYKYIFIRIKPESKFFPIVKELYREMVEIEQSNGVDYSLNFFIDRLNELGFKNYDAFMKEVLKEEVKLKKDLLDTEFSFDNIDDELKNIYKACMLFSKIRRIYTSFYKFIDYFSEVSSSIRKEADNIFNLSDDIRLISLNSSVESYKLGSEGNSFFILSTEMRKNAERSGKAIKEIERIMNESLKQIDDIIFFIGINKLSIYMMSSFLREIISNEVCISRVHMIMEDINDNVALIESYISKLNQTSISLDRKFKDILNLLSKISILIKRLHFLYLTGMVESAHQLRTSFSLIFTQVSNLVNYSKETISRLCSNMNKMANENRKIKDKIQEIVLLIEEAKKELEIEHT